VCCFDTNGGSEALWPLEERDEGCLAMAIVSALAVGTRAGFSYNGRRQDLPLHRGTPLRHGALPRTKDVRPSLRGSAGPIRKRSRSFQTCGADSSAGHLESPAVGYGRGAGSPQGLQLSCGPGFDHLVNYYSRRNTSAGSPTRLP